MHHNIHLVYDLCPVLEMRLGGFTQDYSPYKEQLLSTEDHLPHMQSFQEVGKLQTASLARLGKTVKLN